VPYTFLLDDGLERVMHWWQQNMVVYAHVMAGLARQLGSQIPDSEFVIMANDEPGPGVTDRASMPPLPYFRCAWGGGARR
jgi:hypothetical protein